MSKELRANLIFAVALFVLAAPGFFLLMHKRLTVDTDRRMDLPDPIPHSVAYVQPDPVPPNLPRSEPEAAKAWVEQLVAEHGGGTVFRGAGDIPLVSDRHQTQLIRNSALGEKRNLTLLWWHTPADASQQPTIRYHSGYDMLVDYPPSKYGQEILTVPKAVRHALQRAGYVNPPEKICLWQIEDREPADLLNDIFIRFPDTSRYPPETLKVAP